MNERFEIAMFCGAITARYRTNGRCGIAAGVTEWQEFAIMNPPPDMAVKEDLNLLLWRPQGLLTQKIVNGILAFIREVEAHHLEKTELRFTDTTKITHVELNFEFVFFVAMYRRTTHPRGAAIRSAFLAPNDAFAHYFRLHAVLNQRSSLQARVFADRDAAAHWLNIPLSALEFPEAAPG